ncbi:MAG: PAAR domain-containing protein [Wolbachia pipientis]
MCNQHGDYAPSGGVGGSSNVFVNGKPVHCQGDMWLWHASIDPNKPPHAGHFLLDGSKSVFVNGKAIARTGDKVSCGAKVEQGSNDVFAG